MYELLQNIAKRPKPFSRYTAAELWTRPHLAEQMLSFHLSQDTDLASRRLETIESAVHWIDSQVHLDGKRVCDLGCGPGLYTQRFSQLGAKVTGVDFSENSLAYARAEALNNGLDIDYVKANYLDDDLPAGFDLITLIYTDLCALSPGQRSTLLNRMRSMLTANGRIIIDVAGVEMLRNKEETTLIEEGLMGGFWANGDYIGIQKSFVYPGDLLSLDQYLIIEPDDCWEIYNWFQYFTPAGIESELKQAGFSIDILAEGLSGGLLTDKSHVMGIVAGMT